jgi:hypothetical protein
MLQNLVVIAANGTNYIHRCLDSLGDKYPILVVDTFSDEPIQIDRPNVEVCRMPFKGYGSGAYLWAYWHYEAENYLFLQDTLVAKEPDYLKYFIENQPERGACAWALFSMSVDDDAQSQFIRYCYTTMPEFGLFGPIFYISRASLDELRDKKLLPPTPMKKEHDMACERMWAMAFAQAGMELKSAAGIYDAGRMSEGQFPIFQKDFPNRQ